MANPFDEFDENPFNQFEEHDFDAVNMGMNVPSSAAQYADDLTYPVRHPIETGEGLMNIVKGVGDKLGLDFDDDDQSMYADAAADFVKERYGSVDKFQKSLEEDPVGVSSDIAGLIGVIATPFTGGASLAGSTPSVARFLAKLGNAGKFASRAADPAVWAGKAAKQVGKRLDPNDMYQEVMKFTTTKPLEERRQWAQTLLDERIIPGEAGAKRFDAKARAIGDDVRQRIDMADAKGAEISAQRPLEPLASLRDDVGGYRSGGDVRVKAIDDYADQFVADHGLKGQVTVGDMQDFKTDLYNQINWDTSKQPGTMIDNDIKMAVARGAKEAIEEIDPEIGDLNRRWGDILDARKPLERSSARIDNRNALGLQTPMAAAAAESILPGTGMFAGGASYLFTPKAKAGLAIALNEMQKAGGDINKVPPQVLEGLTNGQVRQLLIQSGRAGQEPSFDTE